MEYTSPEGLHLEKVGEGRGGGEMEERGSTNRLYTWYVQQCTTVVMLSRRDKSCCTVERDVAHSNLIATSRAHFVLGESVRCPGSGSVPKLRSHPALTPSTDHCVPDQPPHLLS